MKTILLNIINADTSYNKNATRYLYKTHPDLWKQVVETTCFLPESALAKQRVWHILNEIYDIPRCPITGEEVKWFCNRYLGTANVSARTTLLNKSGKLNNRSEETNKKRSDSNRKTAEDGLRKPSTISEETIRLRTEKAKETCLKKYGVDNIRKLPAIIKKIQKKKYDWHIANGGTPREQRPLKDLYYDAVNRFTKESWVNYFDKINPQRLNRSEFPLDHIYSIHQGFMNNIPPYIIGHWTNLRIITLIENSSKGKRCSKSQEALFKDFFANIGK